MAGVGVRFFIISHIFPLADILFKAPLLDVYKRQGTFHAVFFSILKHAYRYDASNIVREEQRIQLMRELVDRYRIDVEDEGEFIKMCIRDRCIVIRETQSVFRLSRLASCCRSCSPYSLI